MKMSKELLSPLLKKTIDPFLLFSSEFDGYVLQHLYME
jgi:hypothetical protein